MDIPLDEVIFFDAISSSSTGAAADADSTPTFAVYEEATDTDIGVGGNMTKRTSLTGNYRGSFTASAANGFEVGKWYSIIGSATIGGIATKGVLKSFRIVAAEVVAGYPLTDVAKWLGTTVATPNTAGYPFVTIKNGTGSGELAIDTGILAVNVTQWLGIACQTPNSAGCPVVDLVRIRGGTMTEGGVGRIASAFATMFNIASPVFTAASVNQTGDNYTRIGATGSGLTSLAPSSTALSNVQWTNARAALLDSISDGTIGLAALNTDLDAILAALPTNFSLMRILRDGSVVPWLDLSPPPPIEYPWGSNPDKTFYLNAPSGGEDGPDGVGETPESAFATSAALIAHINGLNRTTYHGIKVIAVGAETISAAIRWPSYTVVEFDNFAYTSSINSNAVCAISADDYVRLYGTWSITSSVLNDIRLPVGYGGSQASSRFVTVEGLTTHDMSDGQYHNSTGPTDGFWTYRNCTFPSNWDSGTIPDVGATHVTHNINCAFTAVGPPVGSTADVRPMTSLGGTTINWNCTIAGTGSASNTKKTYGVKPRGNGFIVCIGGSVAGADYPFGTEDNGCVVAIGVSYTGTAEAGSTFHELTVPTDHSRVLNITATKNYSGTTIKNTTDIAATLADSTNGLAAISAKLPIRLKKNTAFNNFMFPMETVGGVATAGLTVTAQRSIDGAAFANCTNSVSGIASGAYKINLSAADLNGDSVLLKFTATGMRARFIEVVTQA